MLIICFFLTNFLKRVTEFLAFFGSSFFIPLHDHADNDTIVIGLDIISKISIFGDCTSGVVRSFFIVI